MKYLVRGFLLASLCVVVFQAGKILFNLTPDSVESEQQGFCGVSYNLPPLNEVSHKGKQLFQQNCASCHALHKHLTGPALMNVEDRWPSKKLLITWIRNWPKAVRTGDPYAIEMAKSTPSVMNVFEDYLSTEDVESILEYIKLMSSSQSQIMANVNPR